MTWYTRIAEFSNVVIDASGESRNGGMTESNSSIICLFSLVRAKYPLTIAFVVRILNKECHQSNVYLYLDRRL